MADLPHPHESPEFIARQVAIIEARRAEGMNVLAMNKDGTIIKIAPDGTETDVTDELGRRVSEARARMRAPAP